jgi:predicted AAA+ superfamily ATPase
MRYQRLISTRIEHLAKQFPAIVVTGARQVGKTTLLRELFPTLNYVSLDSLPEAELAESNPDEFLRRFPAPLIVDEVQYAPKLFRHLKRAIDARRELRGQFILTGSQKFTLMREVTESLAGRCAVVELEGLCCRELGELVVGESEPTEILTRGSFPELWRDRTISSAEYYRSYLSTYLERDVRQILNVGALRDFDRFMRAIATRSGQLLNKTEIARDVGVTAKTIGDWLSVLEASNQITILEPFFRNITKRVVKSPKLYFCDSGLLCHLLGIDNSSLKTFAGIGSVWETFVLAELRKISAASSQQPTFWFYRDGAAHEVDLVIEKGGRLNLAEIKWAEIPNPRDGASMSTIASELGSQVDQRFIICRTKVSFPVGDSVAIDGFCLRDPLAPGVME